eukprot:TRINITY_DN5064_c0_g1_i7.p7 TRINITY_DN5064_c0_g1~~TRINITY_DN5064_c0_g1_i7.p7  ORF type:complete len:112 (+),score=10.08 TRINITY_DN5064_c0_g1_i7:1530-1865(+)
MYYVESPDFYCSYFYRLLYVYFGNWIQIIQGSAGGVVNVYVVFMKYFNKLLSSGQTLGVKAQRFRGHTSPHRNVKEKKKIANQKLVCEHTFFIFIVVNRAKKQSINWSYTI